MVRIGLTTEACKSLVCRELQVATLTGFEPVLPP
jgi:hypothetical protein